MLQQRNTAPSCFFPDPFHGSDSGNSDEEEIQTLNTTQSKYKVRKVFTDHEKELLAQYFMKAFNLHYGLTYNKGREPAYMYAKKLNQKNYPRSWDERHMAGKDWMYGFLQRQQKLSLHRPENTSLARDAAFNKVNINLVFDNLLSILDKFKFTPDRIMNFDDCGILTIMQPRKVIVECGKK